MYDCPLMALNKPDKPPARLLVRCGGAKGTWVVLVILWLAATGEGLSFVWYDAGDTWFFSVVKTSLQTGSRGPNRLPMEADQGSSLMIAKKHIVPHYVLGRSSSNSQRKSSVECSWCGCYSGVDAAT